MRAPRRFGATRLTIAYGRVRSATTLQMGSPAGRCQLRAAPGRVVSSRSLREGPCCARCHRRSCSGGAAPVADRVLPTAPVVDRAAPRGCRQCAERVGWALRRLPRVPGSGTTQRSSHGRALRALRRRVPSRVGRALLEEAVKQTADPSRAREVLTPCPPLLSGEGERWTVCVLKRLPTRRTGHPPVGGPGHCSAPPHPAA